MHIFLCTPQRKLKLLLFYFFNYKLNIRVYVFFIKLFRLNMLSISFATPNLNTLCRVYF